MNRRFNSNKDKFAHSQQENLLQECRDSQKPENIIYQHSNEAEDNDDSQYLVSPTFRKFPSLSFQNSDQQASIFSFGNPLYTSHYEAFDEIQNLRISADGKQVYVGQTKIRPDQTNEDKEILRDKLKQILKVTEGSKSMFQTVKFSLKMVQQVFKTNRNSFQAMVQIVSKFYERKLKVIKDETEKKLQDARNEIYINSQKCKAAESKYLSLERQLNQLYFRYNQQRVENQHLNSIVQELTKKLEQAKEENNKINLENSSRVTQLSNYNFHRNESFLTASKCSSPQSYINNINKSFMSNTKNSENGNCFNGCISEPKDSHFYQIQNVEIDTESPSSSGKKSCKKQRESLGIKASNKMKTTCLRSRYTDGHEGYFNSQYEEPAQVKKIKRSPYRKYSEQTKGSGLNNRDRMREKINKLTEDLQSQINYLKTNTF